MILKNIYSQGEITPKLIRRCGNSIGTAFVIGMLVNEIIAIILGIFLNPDIFDDMGFIWLYQIIASFITFFIPFIFITKPMNVRLSGVCNFAKPKKDITFPIILVGLAVCMVANVLGGMTVTFFQIIGLEDVSSSLSVDMSSGWLISIAGLIAGSILPGLIEEFALRGVVMGTLRRFGNRFAILVSAGLFGIMHGTLTQIPFAFIVGLYLGFAAIKTGSIWTAFIIHTFNNFFAFLLELLTSNLTDTTKSIISYIYFLVVVFLGFIGIYILRNKKGAFSLKKEEDTNDLTLMQKIGKFSSAPMIIFYLIYIVLRFLSLKLLDVLI